MPKRSDLHKIMIIGSGPIIIGQACEFDYSGTQACKALRQLGYKIVLVNSNPATIMTDPNIADVTYIEPLNVKRLSQIIEIERPDALLPNLGGQSGLNLCSELAKAGVLDKYNVKVIGVQVDAIERGEDRIAFKQSMDKLNIQMAASKPAYSVQEAEDIASELGYPVVVRPAYTMGGAGGGFVYNVEELRSVVARGISASMIGQVLIEESIFGWEELELEVVRDAKGQKITVCFIENIDPVGVHTGDSFCSAPMLTIPHELQKALQKAAYAIVDEVGVIGGTNVQFAYNPVSNKFVVIEINPRTSRSSALASKATGFPIALVSAMLACGLTLDEIPCGKCGTLDKYEPCGDYVVIKFARWAFEKFKDSKDELGTQMKAVGEVMSIGKTYKEALQKAIRSLEIGRYGLGFAKNFNKLSLPQLLELLKVATSERQFILYEAIRKGATSDELFALTKIKHYFLDQMRELVNTEEAIIKSGKNIDSNLLKQAKKEGFSDRYLAMLTGLSESEIAQKRSSIGVVAGWQPVHVFGTQNSAYYYSSYNCSDNSTVSQNKNKIMILGGGPNRIGQGIEFDYCCVHAAFALRELGFETIIVNCNPETVSTDYDTSDKLYFEPLTLEDVISIYNKEKPLGVITQFGGQTPLNLASALEANGVKIIGTSPQTIDLAEDRDLFRAMMEKLNIPMPESGMATTTQEALSIASSIGYPVMVRPSYVLGGRGMEVIYEADALTTYMENAVGVSQDRPILIDRFLRHALEAESDAICDGEAVFVPAVMEHIELAGIHSGDSACVIPSLTISKEHVALIQDYTSKIALELGVKGLMNMQYAIEDDKVYVLEANPRASRTVPLVSKVCSINMVKAAIEIMVKEFTKKESPIKTLSHKNVTHYGVKEAVFPFNMFPEVDPILGPEMHSTGEVLGLSSNFGSAFFKSQEAAQSPIPQTGAVLISVNHRDKPEVCDIAMGFKKLGFKIYSTGRTHQLLSENNIDSEMIYKLGEGRPDILDAIKNRQIDIIVNTPSLKSKTVADDSYIRKAAIKHRIAYFTTIAGAKATVAALNAAKEGCINEVKSLQDYQKGN